MRRFLFSLLILLTAFRGMVGDAMAYGMTSGLMQQVMHSSATIEFIAHHADSMPAEALYASKKHANMPCHEASEDEPTTAASHDCNACQVCHSPVLQRSSLLASLMQAPAAYALREDRTWLSADLTPLQKPPVS